MNQKSEALFRDAPVPKAVVSNAIPSIISMIMVLLFNYYLNYYLINPLLKVTAGIKGWRYHGLSYSVKLDSDDELEELNGAVGDIVEQNQSFKRELEG